MTRLINTIYVLIENKLLFKEIVFNNIEQEFFDESNIFFSSKQLMNKIRETYLKSERLHRIINVKKIEERKILIDFKRIIH